MRMNYTTDKDIRNNEAVRASFNKLAADTFGLSFEQWYQDGYWTDLYIPYVLLDGGRVIANVSVNIIDTQWKGQTRKYIQLGTVMTAPGYRKQGLSRFLLEEALSDWKGLCDAIYLFANDSVLDFYPKFGFVKENEYVYSLFRI